MKGKITEIVVETQREVITKSKISRMSKGSIFSLFLDDLAYRGKSFKKYNQAYRGNLYEIQIKKI